MVEECAAAVTVGAVLRPWWLDHDMLFGFRALITNTVVKLYSMQHLELMLVVRLFLFIVKLLMKYFSVEAKVKVSDVTRLAVGYA